MFNLYKNEMQQVRKPTNLWYKEAKKIDMAVSTLLGPYGMYKMTESGEILSNGKDVIDSIELGPMAEPILDAVSKQYEEFGDGTVSLCPHSFKAHIEGVWALKGRVAHADYSIRLQKGNGDSSRSGKRGNQKN